MEPIEVTALVIQWIYFAIRALCHILQIYLEFRRQRGERPPQLIAMGRRRPRGEGDE